MRFRSLVISTGLLIASLSAQADEYKAGKIHVVHPYARPTMPGQTSGAAYLTLENRGKSPDKLIKLASPAAKSVEIHTMSMEGNVMKMREAPHIEIKPADKVVMKPGDGLHIMLLGIRQPLKAGDKIPLTLTFEKAGTTEISARVEDRSAQTGKEKAAPEHQHHKH